MGCLLENVQGITHMVEGRESTMDVFLRCLRHWCPEFDWCVQTLDALNYKLAQTRVRVFLSGFRKTVKASVPKALPPFGRASLRDFLGHYPHTPRSEYTEPQQTNLKGYELAICELVLAGIVMIFANVNI